MDDAAEQVEQPTITIQLFLCGGYPILAPEYDITINPGDMAHMRGQCGDTKIYQTFFLPDKFFPVQLDENLRIGLLQLMAPRLRQLHGQQGCAELAAKQFIVSVAASRMGGVKI